MAVERFVEFKRRTSGVGEEWLRRMRWELERLPRLLRAGDGTVVRRPSELRPAHLEFLRSGTGWEKATVALHFAALRQFLTWTGHPIARESYRWTLPAGRSSRRRWLTRDQLLRLIRSSQGADRILVVLEGLNGLRRIEVLRLRVHDVLPDEACLRVLGKGPHGGKWRRIPMHPMVVRALAEWIPGKAPSDRVLPLSRSGADHLLATAVRRAGLGADGVRVSHHDLRRTFGRLSHEAGMDLVQLKNLFGHSSLDMTVHYIGRDADEMRSGLDRLSRHLGLPAAGRPAEDAHEPLPAPDRLRPSSRVVAGHRASVISGQRIRDSGR